MATPQEKESTGPAQHDSPTLLSESPSMQKGETNMPQPELFVEQDIIDNSGNVRAVDNDEDGQGYVNSKESTSEFVSEASCTNEKEIDITVLEVVNEQKSNDQRMSMGVSDGENEDLQADIYSKDNTIVSATFEGTAGLAYAPAVQSQGGESTPADSRRTTQASGLVQILALLRKNILTKYRTPLATFFEVFSPLLMMLILALAYQLTDITYEDAKMYSSISFDIPGPWLGLLRTGGDLFAPPGDEYGGLDRRTFRQRRSLGKFDELAASNPLSWNGIFHGLQQQSRAKSIERDLDGNTRRLDEIEDEDELQTVIYDLLYNASMEIATVLESPIPVPAFDEYVGASSLLSSSIGVDDLPRIFSDSSFGQQWGNLLTLGTIHLAPRSKTTDSFWSYLNESYPELMQSTVEVRDHEDEKQALAFINSNLNERTWALLDFSQFGLSDNKKKFKIRMNYTTVPNTNEITDFVSIGLNTEYQMYYLSGYLTLQRTVNEFAFSQAGCSDEVDELSTLWSMPMPTAAYSQNPFFLQVGYLLGLTMVMAYLYPTSRLIKTLVEEKETKMKETMFMLGLRGWAHWSSWILTSLAVFFIITVTVTASLTSTVLFYSDPVYIFVWVGLFSTATIGFCFTLAAIFSRAKLAAIVGPIALFATLLPRFIFFDANRYEATLGKTIASLLPATAFAFGADIVADYEYAEQGIQEWNASEGDYSFNSSLGLLLFDTLLYIFLGWYLDQIIPRQYGVARPFYFLLLPSYWLSFCISRSRRGEGALFTEGVTSEEASDAFEPVDTDQVPGVVIRNLVKRYRNRRSSHPPAVDDLSLTMYESQITALLGHNGAGKTSTVSVLTGLFPPTSGNCFLYGQSIVSDLHAARASIGICPQHNILFGSLTVFEHLAFFMRIKGIRPQHSLVESQAAEIGLTEYLRTKSSALSGGNKRKLSVAIALSGDPSVLVLDEPTSAMDPHSRRAVWKLLRAKRQGRVTLLTTHFMDEAELLSDRIAVLKDGKLQCCGSAMFLKERFGLGYNLTVVLEPLSNMNDEEDQDQKSQDDDPGVDEFGRRKRTLLAFLQERIPNTTLVRVSGKELTFRFPQGSEALFPGTFNALEVERQAFGLGAYGVQNSSLEEVFLQIADDHPATQNEQKDVSPIFGLEEPSVTESESTPIEETTLDHLSPLRQVGLLYKKRLLVQRRDVKGGVFSIVLPVLVIALVLLILMIEPPFAGNAIEVNPSLYDEGLDSSASSLEVLAAVGSVTNQSSLVNDVLAVNPSFMAQYYFVELSILEEITTSDDLSQYLLKTYNERNRPVRFGAYALDDTITAKIRVDWEEIRTYLQSETLSGDQSFVKLVEDLSVNLNVGDFSDWVYGITPLVPLSEISMLAVFAEGLRIAAGGLEIEVGALEWRDFYDNLFMQLSNSSNAEFELEVNTAASILHNSSSPHAVAAFNQAYAEQLYATCSGIPMARLISVNEPLPLTSQQSIEVQTILSILAALFLLIPFCYIPGAFIVFLVKERTSKSKHLQLVSGVNMTAYWVSTYLWDLSLFLVLTICVMIVFLLYGSESARVFVGDVDSFFASMLLIIGYGFSVLPFSYLLARNADNPSAAQISVIGIIFISGFVAVTAYFIMLSIESTEDLALSLRRLFRFWPAYNIGEGFIQLATAFWEREILFNDRQPLDWDVTGKSIALLFGLGPVYFLLLLFLEYSQDGGSGGVVGRLLRGIRRASDQLMLRWYGVKEGGNLSFDDGVVQAVHSNQDIRQESDFVDANPDLQMSAPVVLRGLWKVYPPSVGVVSSCFRAVKKRICCSRKESLGAEEIRNAVRPRCAVRGVTYAVQRGEVFGLLGSNGAGKTTTLGVLTGDIASTNGQVFVAGHDMSGQTPGGVAEARKWIGFCPQTDPLLDLMTGRETLHLFGRLRGIPFDRIGQVVDGLLDRLTLGPHADKTSESYSGGNKRKLSLGIAALVGQGGVLLIDECSSGLDPLARKKLWGLIEQLAKKRSVIITTHSMEEAEALCSRIGIMAHGQFAALGSVQHLKSKYLDGYTIDISCCSNTTEEQIGTIVDDVVGRVVPGSILSEQHGRFLKFEVSRVSVIGLGTTFERLQELKSSGDAVENYSISQCSLEQVFIKLVKDSDDEVPQANCENSE